MTKVRRYDIDALRVLAFFVLILYHVAMVYVADWGFHIKSQYKSEWLKFPMILVNQWRMPLLFLISGVACSLVLRKRSAADFIRRRLFRLGLPFTIGIILVIPPQAYLEALANGAIARGFGEMTYPHFLWHYFTFQGWPEGTFDGSDYGFTWNHLWFIPYLMVYTSALIPVRAILRFTGLEVAFDKVGPFSLVLLPVLLQIFWQLVLNDEKDISHALIDDSYAHGLYFTYFMLGYLISDKSAVWAVIVSLRWFYLGTAVLTYFSLITLWWLFNQHEWQGHLAGVVETFNQWLWLLAVLAWSARLLNQPQAWVAYANDRVFPWYIFHQTLTIAAAYLLAPFTLGGAFEFSLVCFATAGGCLFLTDIVLARWYVLKRLFGMRAPI